jgi:hypothetical protein
VLLIKGKALLGIEKQVNPAQNKNKRQTIKTTTKTTIDMPVFDEKFQNNHSASPMPTQQIFPLKINFNLVNSPKELWDFTGILCQQLVSSKFVYNLLQG